VRIHIRVHSALHTACYTPDHALYQSVAHCAIARCFVSSRAALYPIQSFDTYDDTIRVCRRSPAPWWSPLRSWRVWVRSGCQAEDLLLDEAASQMHPKCKASNISRRFDTSIADALQRHAIDIPCHFRDGNSKSVSDRTECRLNSGLAADLCALCGAWGEPLLHRESRRAIAVCFGTHRSSLHRARLD